MTGRLPAGTVSPAPRAGRGGGPGSRRRGFRARASPALAFSLLVAGTAVAQEPADSVVLSGWIIDATSRQPLSSAYVVAEGTGARMVTGEGGGFRLMVPRAEGYELRVGRFGYLEMLFRIGEERVEEHLIMPLEVEPIALEGLEVTVDRLAELERRLTRRTRGYHRSVRTLERERIERSGTGTALDLLLGQGGSLFECWGTPGELCARPRPLASLRRAPPRESPVPVCLDERRLWGGTAELQALPVEEVYRVELYGFGGRDQIRLYTRGFMARASAGERRALPPVSFGC